MLLSPRIRFNSGSESDPDTIATLSVGLFQLLRNLSNWIRFTTRAGPISLRSRLLKTGSIDLKNFDTSPAPTSMGKCYHREIRVVNGAQPLKLFDNRELQQLPSF